MLAVGKPFRKVYIDPPHHVSYYPGAQFLLMKVLFDPKDGTLLGAQIVGSEAVDKEIDTLSMAIQCMLAFSQSLPVLLAHPFH